MHIKIEDKMIKIFVLPLIEITIIINKKITSKMIKEIVVILNAFVFALSSMLCKVEDFIILFLIKLKIFINNIKSPILAK